MILVISKALENMQDQPHLITTEIQTTRGWPGFDVGCKAVQGIPRLSSLVNTAEKSIVANDETYALAA